MSNIVNKAGATGKHIYSINNTHADLIANLGVCQLGIETDTGLFAYKDQAGAYHNNQPLISGVPADVLAKGGPAGVGFAASMLSQDAYGNTLAIGFDTVQGNPLPASDLMMRLCPASGYDALFNLAWAGESFRVHSDLSVLMAAGNWLEFGEVNHYIRNKSNHTVPFHLPDLALSDLEIGSSYGNTVFLSGGGCWAASESLRVGYTGFGDGDGYGIQAPGVWLNGFGAHVVKTDANGKLVACSNLSDASYQPLNSNLTAISSITPVRGGLIVANATPQYAALALGGASGSILTRNATDPGWSAYYLAGTAGQTYTFPSTTASIVGGSGTQYYVPLWGSGGAVLGNSLIQQDASATAVIIGDNLNSRKFNVRYNPGGTSGAGMDFGHSGTGGATLGILATATGHGWGGGKIVFYDDVNGHALQVLDCNNGNIWIGGTSAATAPVLYVNGNGQVSIGGAPTGTHAFDIYKTGTAVYMAVGDLSSTGPLFYVGSDGTNAYLMSRNNQPLAFGANNTSTQLIIGTSGQLTASYYSTGILYSSAAGLISSSLIAAGTIPMGSATTGLTASVITQSSSMIGINCTAVSTLTVKAGTNPIMRLLASDYVASSAGSQFQFHWSAATGVTDALIDALTNGGNNYGNIQLNSGGGNVGIGMSPTYTLDITGTLRASGNTYLAGAVGIGCAAAAGKTLDIQGAASAWACVRLTSPTSTYGGYFSVVNNSGNVLFGVETSAGGGLFTGSSAYAAVIGHSGNYPLQFATNNTIGMTLNTTGVGIGSTNPLSLFETRGNYSGGAAINSQITLSDWRTDNPSSGNGVSLDFALGNNSGTPLVRARIAAVNNYYKARAYLVFYTSYGDVCAEKMRLDELGNVGIGNTAPGNTLTLGTAGNQSASFGIADVQTVTASGDQNLTPTSTRIELNGSFNFALLAGSLPNGTLIIIVRGSGSGGYPVVTFNGHNYTIDANHSFMFMKNSAGTWYPLTPYTS